MRGAVAVFQTKLLLAHAAVLIYPAAIMIAGMLIAATFLLLGVVVFTYLQKA
jgi:hypothetical protein